MKHCFSSFIISSVLLLSASVSLANTGCLSCHPQDLFVGATVHTPVRQGMCDECHNPHVAKFPGLLSKQGAAFCYSCHHEEKRAFATGRVHDPVAQGQCLQCHAAHASEQPALLKETLRATCLSCHDQFSTPFEVPHQPFAEGNCTACHTPHNADNIQLLKASAEELCLQCHAKPDALAGHQGFPAKVEDCLSCHSPHGSDRPGLLRSNLHEPFSKGCSSCHDKNLLDQTELCLTCHSPVAEQMLATHTHLLPGEKRCTRCHSPHASDQKALLRTPPKQLCRSCHSDTFHRSDQRQHKHPKIEECVDCHDVHGSERTAMLRDDGNAVCSRCHESQGTFSHPVGGDVIDPRVNQVVTCLTCHNPMGTDYRYNLKLSGKKALCVQCHRSY